MAIFEKKVIVTNLDNVDNQDYFTEELKKGDNNLDSTLYIDGERLTVRKQDPSKKMNPGVEKEKPPVKKKDDLDELFLDDEEKARIHERDRKGQRLQEFQQPQQSQQHQQSQQPIIKKSEEKTTPVIVPIKEPVLPKEQKPFEMKAEPRTELKTEVPIKKEEPKPIISVHANEKVNRIGKVEEKPKEEIPPKIEVIKLVKDIENKAKIYIDDSEIESAIRKLEDLVHDISDKIYKSNDKEEIDYYIKQLYKIIEEINRLIKELDKGKDWIKFDEASITNKEQFLANYEYYTKKLDTLQKEYVDKEIETGTLKRNLIEDQDKEKDKKMLEADRKAMEAKYFQKKIENDLYYIKNAKERIREIAETRERVQRTYVGVRRVLRTLANSLAVATILPGPLAMLAIIGSQIRAMIGLAGQMINPQYQEYRYEETIITEEVSVVGYDLDDSDIAKAEKDLDEIIKDFDYLMRECYRLFNEDPKYKDLFDELKEIKSLLDSQKQELTDLQKTSSKQLVLQKEPINE